MARKPQAGKRQAEPKRAAPRRKDEGRRQLRFEFGARRQEIAGVLLIMLGALSLLSLSGITAGSLSSAGAL